MFEHHREKQAAKHFEQALASWQEQRDAQAKLLELATTFTGINPDGLIVKPGEAVFASVTGVGLIESRAGRGHYVGGSQGVSLPIGSIGGHSVRYRVGVNRGHYEAAEPVATAIDTGTLYITDQRVIFEGAMQTRECLFDKLIGFQHTPDGATVFSVSNRKTPTTVHYGPKIAGWVDFRLDLALAHYRNTVPALVARLTSDLAATDAAKPSAPALPAG